MKFNEVSCRHNPLQLPHPISACPRLPPLLLPSSPSPGLVPKPHTPSPSRPFAGLPVPWPPPLPAFVAAFVLAPALWGPAALLPSCSVSSSSSSLRWSISTPRCPGTSPRRLAPPNPPVPSPARRPGASLALGALLCVSARSGFLRGQ